MERASDDPALARRLSQRLGREVTLLDQPPPGASLDHYWPPVEGRELWDATDEWMLLLLLVVVAGAIGSRLGSRHWPVAWIRRCLALVLLVAARKPLG